MNIKYKFNNGETVSTPLTPIELFKEPGIIDGGLYPWNPSQIKKPAEIFDANIRLINERISKITKELTYWDLYKLVKQVTSPTELDSTFAGLIPGQACVINCNSFTNNGQDYHRGDVIIKMLDNEPAYIPAVSSGVYFPVSMEKSGSSNYILTYQFQPTADPLTKEYTLEPTDVDNSFVYGIFKTKSELDNDSTFANYKYNNKTIKPIIKFYNDEHEEIDIHVTASLDSTETTWSITSNIPSCVAFMQVK